MTQPIERQLYELSPIELDYEKEYPFKHTKVFEANLRAVMDKDNDWYIIINQGGTSSSKTYSIIQLILLILNDNPNWLCTVCGETLPSLKDGAIKDYEDIISTEPYFAAMIDGEYHRGDQYGKLKNGSKIQFKAYDKPKKAKPGKREMLFVTEANAVHPETVKHLLWRTKAQVFFDFNADEAFYVHEKYKPRDDSKMILSDYRHNRYCSTQQKKELEDLKEINYEDWKVYARGKTGKPSVERPFFENFDKERHVKSGLYLDPQHNVIQSWDFNRNPVSVIFAQLIHGQGLYVIKEFQKDGGTRKLLEMLSDYVGAYQYEIFGDNSGHSEKSSAEYTDWQLIESAFNTKISPATYNANKRHLFSRRLCNHAFWKIPIFISKEGCPRLINELEFAERTEDGKLKKDDDKHRNDLVDCYRYLNHYCFEDIAYIDVFSLKARETIAYLTESMEDSKKLKNGFKLK